MRVIYYLQKGGCVMSDHVYSREEIINAVLPLLKKYSADRAILFGSYARQEATPHSDIDLVIIGENGFDPTDVFCIADELFRTMKKNVDVYEIREIEHDSPFYNAIMSEGVQIA